MRILSAAAIDSALDWPGLVAHLDACHRGGPAQVDDSFLHEDGKTLLTRAAWLPGGPFGLKTVSVFPDNAAAGRPSVQGVVVIFDPETGGPAAVLDGAAITRWKTVGDSLCAARRLARPDARRLLVVGAGVIAGTLLRGYRALFPQLESIAVWNRTAARAEELAEAARAEGIAVTVAGSLEEAVADADIVSSATMARQPFLPGAAVSPGTHVDLIGAFKADMREADDTLLRKARIFVDTRETTMHDIGELRIPLEAGTITPDAVVGDLYALCQDTAGRQGDGDVTLFKNGGGAHLDMMVAAYALSRCA